MLFNFFDKMKVCHPEIKSYLFSKKKKVENFEQSHFNLRLVTRLLRHFLSLHQQLSHILG